MNKDNLKRYLLNATSCKIQHDGWTCGTCFFAISSKLKKTDWQNVLLIRGDYKKEDLNNLPKDRVKSYNKIIRLCEVQTK